MSNARIAVVTGASSGIGRVICERLSSSGTRVLAFGQNKKRLEEVSARTGAIPFAVDISDPVAVADAWVRIESEHGVPDLLINNAGIAGSAGRTWEQEPRDWWRIFEVNVRGTFLMSRAALPAMLQAGGGRIVNVSSNAAFYPIDVDDELTVDSAYMASKAAVIRFTEALAAEVATGGVRVFAISPGMVKTAMTERIFADYWDEPDLWTSPETTADLIEFIAAGGLDGLSGRYIHAATDDWRSLGADAAAVVSGDWHSLRMRTRPPDQ